MNSFLCRSIHTIIEMSLSAGCCILLVLLIRPLFLKCSRKAAYYLWIAVLIHLAVPVRLQGPFSLIPASAEGFIAAGALESDQLSPAQPGAADTAGNTVQNLSAVINPDPGQRNAGSGSAADRRMLSETDRAQALDQLPDAAQKQPETGTAFIQKSSYAGRFWRAVHTYSLLLAVLWLAGLAAILLFHLLQLARMKKWTSHENWIYWDDTLRTAEVDKIPAPFIWGLIHPVIFLPAGISQSERTYIIAHENFHRRRHDHLVKMAAFAAASLHWFNPLVWAAWFLFCKDMEISCDEAVLSNSEADIKKQYAQSLLKYAAAQSGYYMTPPSFGSPSAKLRIRHILHYKKRSPRFSKAAGCAALAAALMLNIHPASADSAGRPGRRNNSPQTAEPAASDSASNSIDTAQNPDPNASPFGYTDYSGYLDACTKWEACRHFQNCDYDGDGLTDRVFRQETKKNNAVCEYRIEFGNGDVLQIPNAVYDGMPSVQAGDLNGDGKNEILFTQEYPLSTSPDSFGNMILFTKTGGSYEKAALPLTDSVYNSHQPCLSIRYRMRGSDAFFAEVKETGYQARLQIAEGFKEYYARLLSERGETYSEHCVCSAALKKSGKKTVLSCRVSLLDKWCIDNIAFWIVYENGAYTIQNMTYEPNY